MDEQDLNKVLVTLPPRVDREARTAWTYFDQMGCVGIAPVSCAQEKGGTARVHLRRVSSCGMSGIINY